MAIPTYVNHGAQSIATTTITPALPASIAVDDILLLYLITKNEAVTIANQNGGTWAEVDQSGQGTPGVLTACRVTIFWSRYNGTQGAPTTNDPGDVVGGYIAAFRGCKETGDPWDVKSKNTESTEDTSLVATGAATTVADCLVVVAAALFDDTPNFGTWVNADLANITDRLNFGFTSGGDGRLMTVTGEKASAGTYGDTTNTLTANARKAMMTVALAPAGGQTAEQTDPLGLTDSISRGVGLTRTDPVGLVDDGSAVLTRDFDPLGLTDSIVVTETAPVDHTQSKTDPLGLLDSLVVDQISGSTFTQTHTDSLGLVDSIVVAQGFDVTQAATDALGLLDSIVVAHTVPPPVPVIVWDRPPPGPGTTTKVLGSGT